MEVGKIGGWKRDVTPALSSPAQAEDMKADRWQNLEVWKLADELAFKIYHATRRFPKYEIYGITSQLRRAALSVPTNIVEGYSRKGDRELSRFFEYQPWIFSRNEVSAALFKPP